MLLNQQLSFYFWKRFYVTHSILWFPFSNNASVWSPSHCEAHWGYYRKPSLDNHGALYAWRGMKKPSCSSGLLSFSSQKRLKKHVTILTDAIKHDIILVCRVMDSETGVAAFDLLLHRGNCITSFQSDLVRVLRALNCNSRVRAWPLSRWW